MGPGQRFLLSYLSRQGWASHWAADPQFPSSCFELPFVRKRKSSVLAASFPPVSVSLIDYADACDYAWASNSSLIRSTLEIYCALLEFYHLT